MKSGGIKDKNKKKDFHRWQTKYISDKDRILYEQIKKEGGKVRFINKPGLENDAFQDNETNQNSEKILIDKILDDGKVVKEEYDIVGGVKVNPIIRPDASSIIINYDIIKFPSGVEEYTNIETLFNDIMNYIHKYVDVPIQYEQLAAYYSIFSWFYDRFRSLGYLRVIGDFGSGKSRFLTVVGNICYKPIFCSGITKSALFHLINQIEGTPIMDEGDIKDSDETHDFVKMLNAGTNKNTPFIISEPKKGGGFKPTPYNVFGPKIISTRERFVDEALESRCLTQRIEVTERDDIPIELPKEFDDEAQILRNKLLKLRLDNYFIVNYEDIHIPNIEPRLNQIINPICSVITDKLGRDRLYTFVNKLNVELLGERQTQMKALVAEAIYELQTSSKVIMMQSVADYLNEKYHFTDKYEMTSRKVSSSCKKLGLQRTMVNGRSGVKINDKIIKTFCRRYGVDKINLEEDDSNKPQTIDSYGENENVQ